MEIYDARRDGLSGLRIRDDSGKIVGWIENDIGLGKHMRQTSAAAIEADTSLTSEEFADLLSIDMTTNGGDLLITASVSASITDPVGDAAFRLSVDGVECDDTGTRANLTAPNEANGISIVKSISVPAGPHTVALQWRTTNVLSTVQVRPIGAADYEHASMFVHEVV